MAEHRQIRDANALLKFIFAGNAIFTLRSVESGTSYTFKVEEAPQKAGDRRPPAYFVGVLSGPDNLADYTYMGTIFQRTRFCVTEKSKMKPSSPPCMAFGWSFKQFLSGKIPVSLEFWHAGRCARCGRVLTDDESIDTGFGPDCAGIAGVPRAVHKVGINAQQGKFAAQTKTRKAAPPVNVYAANGFRSKAEISARHSCADIEAMIRQKMETEPDIYYQNGEFKANGMDEDAIHSFWFRRFESMPLENFRGRKWTN
jgi:hypothetical protein